MNIIDQEADQDAFHLKLATVTLYQWEALLTEIEKLVVDVRTGSIMDVAEQTLFVEAQLDTILKR